jgi:hypothetical protein
LEQQADGSHHKAAWHRGAMQRKAFLNVHNWMILINSHRLIFWFIRVFTPATMPFFENNTIMENIDFVELLAEKVAAKVLESIKPMLADNQPKPLTREELMKRLDVSSATLWKWERTGEIKRAFTIGKRAYYYLPTNSKNN